MKMRPANTALLFLALQLGAGSAIADGKHVDALVEEKYPALQTIYRDIHANPELGFHEMRTAKLLAGELQKIGFDVTLGLGVESSVVAVLKNGDGPTIMLRTELDALPMEEKTGLEYASRVQVPATQWPGNTDSSAKVFVAHSCGHDVHMAAWLGAAQMLVDMKDQWRGTLLLVGEPAEEIGGGATAMLKAGLFEKFPKPDFGFAVHINSDPSGKITVKDGAFSGNSDTFDLTFKGRGAHGSAPHLSIDPIVIGARFVTDIQAVVSREKDPREPGVITVGSFQAGTAGNIIPDQAKLKLTMRSTSPETRQLLLDAMHRVADSAARSAMAPDPEFLRIGGGAVAGVNSSQLIEDLKPSLDASFTDITYVPAAVKPNLGVETYPEFIEAGVPSIFYWIGASSPAQIEKAKLENKPVPANHSPLFSPDADVAIRTGAKVLALSVLEKAKIN
ncbi:MULTISPECIES: amidohydrolase [Agrobacterium]|uniref:Amidohydrolase n=1 Tax=Agrobacterium rubi TaxID=28099 RepID=A0AAE7RA84_9HYPH|nr:MULTISPECIES: amidohydrolase [Agrobacterium]MBN7807796.1 amidohydrolase [Agrobacterium rosae]NTE89755.1 amidohydrolase [Agrobacterium rubi]NTF05395.1 amidohydrolase [Agrobacterium rubi]NTF39839.1 amidohydrolase [Agrobacterium rubi]QTG03328.1 amidohydrolase [Agrobacterium rubi]